MQQETVALQLDALGNVTRLEICLLLVEAGDRGIKVGKINEIIGTPASTLSHHLARLVNSGLVSQERKGRNLVCRVNTETLDNLVMHMATNFCGDDSEIWG